VLKKGDKVVIHTHKYVELYKDKIFTCSTDEEEYDGDGIVFLKELATLKDDHIGRAFLTKFLTKVSE
jgi:hypothetical protein